MSRIPLVGGSYVSQSQNADCERTVNLYPELIESGNGKSKAVLLGTPGKALFLTLATGPVLCLAWVVIESGGAPITKLLAVGGSKLYDLNLGWGDPVLIGDIGAASSVPPQIFSNGKQVFVNNNGSAYTWDGITLAAVAGFPVVGAFHAAYLDGYFAALEPLTRKVYISNLYDGATWDPLDYGVKEGDLDVGRALYADHHLLWVMGSKTCEPWQNTGNPDFPFEPIPGGAIEQGCTSRAAVSKLDNSIFFLGNSDRGGPAAWRINGYTPVRVSTHAVEAAWTKYANIFDAVSYAYQEQGHAFWVVSFPTGNATWVYDVTTGLWHERGYWDGANYVADWARFHLYVEGTGHLVGDYRNGNIYLQSTAHLNDAGAPIRRLRRTPHISEERKWMHHPRLRIDAQPGVDAEFKMRFSDDGGLNWSHEYSAKTEAAKTRALVEWRRLGRSRDRVYDIYTDSAAPIALVDGYVEIQPGLGF